MNSNKNEEKWREEFELSRYGLSDINRQDSDYLYGLDTYLSACRERDAEIEKLNVLLRLKEGVIQGHVDLNRELRGLVESRNENLVEELETTKKQLDDLQVFIHRFQEEFYLNNSASGLSRLYADIVEYDLAKLSKEDKNVRN